MTNVQAILAMNVREVIRWVEKESRGLRKAEPNTWVNGYTLSKTAYEKVIFLKIMLRKLASVEGYKAQNLPLDQLSYSSSVSAYDIGTWFIAYLIHNEGIEAFRDQFYGKIGKMAFDEAFELSFGKTRSQYLNDFDEFLNNSEDEIMLIIDK